jgi:hypothetical protein
MSMLIENFDFIVGLCVGAILIFALTFAPLFRVFALSVAAGTIIVVYSVGGAADLLLRARTYGADIVTNAELAVGIGAGVILAASIAFLSRPKRMR